MKQHLHNVVFTAWLIGAGAGTVLVSVGFSLFGLGFGLFQTALFTGCAMLVSLALSLPFLFGGLALVASAPDFVLRHRTALCITVPTAIVIAGLLLSLAADNGHSAPVLVFVGADAAIAALWCWLRTRAKSKPDARKFTRLFE